MKLIFALLIVGIFPDPGSKSWPAWASLYFDCKRRLIHWHRAQLSKLDRNFARQQTVFARADEIGQREDGAAKFAVVGPIPGCDFGVMLKPVASDSQTSLPLQEPLEFEAALAEFRPDAAGDQSLLNKLADGRRGQPDRFRPR